MKREREKTAAATKRVNSFTVLHIDRREENIVINCNKYPVSRSLKAPKPKENYMNDNANDIVVCIVAKNACAPRPMHILLKCK